MVAKICTLVWLTLSVFAWVHAGEFSMRVEKVSAFYVIGKLGQGSVEDKDSWIPPLWAEASGNVNEIAGHVKRANSGMPSGIWAIMSDHNETFKPWDATGGKYLAGFEALDDSAPPDGWVKWRVPDYEYVVVETTLARYGEAFSHTLTTLLPEKGLALAGAVHERYPSPDDPSVVELYFPVHHSSGTARTEYPLQIVRTASGKACSFPMQMNITPLSKSFIRLA
ncbi:MAG: GyrI-like domain-containing protein [Planctomycetaceae bacterium]|nr:GyrI-like domain-containing protein [Planctomycetaceae bacterium]